jgi:hypothetical protein
MYQEKKVGLEEGKRGKKKRLGIMVYGERLKLDVDERLGVDKTK